MRCDAGKRPKNDLRFDPKPKRKVEKKERVTADVA